MPAIDHTSTTGPSSAAVSTRAEDRARSPVSLRILCWDHPRCTEPMRAAAERYGDMHPEVELSLRSRSLASFNDEPIEGLAREADLVVFDHPMVPRAGASGALLALDVLADELRESLALTEAVGASQASYDWQGHTWGVAVDAACQVAVARPDRLWRLGARAPATWDEVLTLAAEHPGAVALPLYHSDAFCALLSLSAALAPDGPDDQDGWLVPDAVRLLCELARLVDPACLELNPPALLHALRAGQRWAYVPLTFGYVHAGSRSELAWFDAPRVDGGPPGSVLGGAGLGVTRHASSPAQALRFALWYARAETQRDIVLTAGGQPAARAVWDDPSADARAHGMFSRTRRTIEHAVVRPRAPWWPLFQAQASARLHELLPSQAPAPRVHAALLDIHHSYADP
jgi:multiple sugar transport system substrate-binding protein